MDGMELNGANILRSLGSELETLLKDIPVAMVVRGVQLYSRALFVRYFKGYRIQVAGKKRVRELVDKEIIEKGSEELAQLLMTLWNRSNGKLYHDVYTQVRKVDEEVDRIELIDDARAGQFLDELLVEHDADRLYLCILFNEVKFSKAVIQEKLGKVLPFDPWPPAPHAEEEEGEAGAAPAAGETAPAGEDGAPAAAEAVPEQEPTT